MTVFFTDLDNTIIYSYKRDIGENKRCVELYQGREVSFITDKTYELLNKVKDKVLIVPTTTRTIEQYERINLGIGTYSYALTCNGGILLKDGIRDEEWYSESLKLIKDCREEVEKAIEILDKEERRYFELRYIENLFVFTKCHEPLEVVEMLKAKLDSNRLRVFSNGDKVYVVPKVLSKGNAIKRLKKIIKPDYTIAAGDSEFDITMVTEADAGLVPAGFREKYNTFGTNILEMKEDGIFSEQLLNKIMSL